MFMMQLKRSFRTLILLLLIGSFTIGLESCRLPASKGPQEDLEASEGFPVPGETKVAPPTAGAGVTSATQTAQVSLPVVVSPGQTATPAPYPNPADTAVPGAPEPTPTEVVYIEPTPGGPPATYTLQEGEFPFCIARRYDVNQNELLSLNGLTTNSFFYAGQELALPQTGNPFDGERTLHEHPTTYKILEGDTLNTIACYFGDMSPDLIALQNNLSTPELPPGEVLIIP
jgi:LysM repeat protein